MNKILLIKTSALGDIVHTYPLLHYLKDKFPAAKIDWVVESAYQNLVNSHPFISTTIPVSTKMWRKNFWRSETFASIAQFRIKLRKEFYDLVFDLQGNIKSGLILSQVRSKCKVGFALKTVPEWPNVLFSHIRFNPLSHINIREEYLSLAASFFGDPHPNSSTSIKLQISSETRASLQTFVHNRFPSQSLRVVVAPGSNWKNKQLNQESLRRFLIKVEKFLKCSFLFTWGSAEEKIVVEMLHNFFPENSCIMEKMELAALQNLMGMCDLVIAMDSLPLHLAGTASVKTFSVFGASSALKYKPIGDNHYAIQGNCPYNREFAKRCPILRSCPTGSCIRDLTADHLFNAFQTWWKEKF